MNIIIKNAQIKAGNFVVSIGTFESTDVAIISKHSGNFVQLRQTKVSKKLRKIKRTFRHSINSDTTFTFSHMQADAALELIAILKK